MVHKKKKHHSRKRTHTGGYGKRKRSLLGEIDTGTAIKRATIATGTGYIAGKIIENMKESHPEHGHDRVKMGIGAVALGFIIPELAHNDKDVTTGGDALMGVGGYLLSEGHSKGRYSDGRDQEAAPVNGDEYILEGGNTMNYMGESMPYMGAGVDQGGVGGIDQGGVGSMQYMGEGPDYFSEVNPM